MDSHGTRSTTAKNSLDKMTSHTSSLSFSSIRKICVTNSPSNNPQLYPFKDLPKFVLLGRSNVGKSTLLNCLCQSKLVKSSKAPGSSQQFSFFLVSNRALLVDTPGYGFSKAPIHKKQEWTRAWSSYLHEEDATRIFILLIDAKVGPKPQDIASLTWLDGQQIPFFVVLTKWDRLTRKEKDQWKDPSRIENVRPLQILKYSIKDKFSWKQLAKALQDVAIGNYRNELV